ncbi:MAG: alkaline phosphatase family protein [Ilumatobacter sp.]|uniref:alkaline phosphatase family protein n=1 Tax=Ilumatobacter sp. TaxID=1967498 RepID=UPI00261068AE|nr:alkaline phosphatase family protein [Ilumatobacter sp.]MDJ0767543.1 alkaline phosphatase family protein [Ilumatobacter sp.]
MTAPLQHPDVQQDGLPIVPDYAGANVRGIVPALLGPGGWGSGLPEWMPGVVAEADQVVLLVLDGVGWDQLQERRGIAPTLAGLDGGPITTVAPTTTATALSSIATGLTPGEHGLVGYRMVLGGRVMNVLRWAVDGQDMRRSQPPADVQRFPSFLGEPVPVVSPSELCYTAFSAAHLAGSVPVGYRATSSLAIEVRRRLVEGDRFVYAYYGGVDKIAHERGFGEFYDAELRDADRLVADLLDTMPAGAALLVTADHGQVEVGDAVIVPSVDLLAHVAMQSGEGRFRWLHAQHGATADLLDAATEEFGDTAWVRSRDQLIGDGWFGPSVPPPVAARLGDVAVIARAPVSYFDPDDSGPFELICRHGSMTSAEVYVPLLAGMPT